MGFGDDIMATAYARRVAEETPGTKVVFGDPESMPSSPSQDWEPYFSEVFLNNPHIVQPGESWEGAKCIPDFPGCRPYIDYKRCEAGEDRIISRWAFQDKFRAPRGNLFFSEAEQREAIAATEPLDGVSRLFVVEPNINTSMTQNKAWLFDRWRATAERLSRDGMVIQMGPAGMRSMPEATRVQTDHFRSACHLLWAARERRLTVTILATDCALHHLAAALSIPAVVLWTGYTSPRHLGYDDHINIAPFDIHKPSGLKADCPWCRKNAEKITVDEVVAAALAT